MYLPSHELLCNTWHAIWRMGKPLPPGIDQYTRQCWDSSQCQQAFPVPNAWVKDDGTILPVSAFEPVRSRFLFPSPPTLELRHTLGLTCTRAGSTLSHWSQINIRLFSGGAYAWIGLGNFQVVRAMLGRKLNALGLNRVWCPSKTTSDGLTDGYK